MVSYPRTYAALVAALKRDEIPPFFPPSLPLKGVPEVTNVYRCLDPIHAAMRDGRYDDAFARLLLAIRQCVKLGFREGTQKFVNLVAQIERARGELDRERDARLLELDILEHRNCRKEEIAEALMVLASLDTLRGDTDAAARTMERLHGFEGWRNNANDI